MPKQFQCLICTRRVGPTQRQKFTVGNKIYLQCEIYLGKQPQPDMVICMRCRSRLVKKGMTLNSTKSVGPGVKSRTIRCVKMSHRFCFLCKSKRHRMMVLTSEARTDAYLRYRVLIPPAWRCCIRHLDHGFIKDNATLDHLQGFSIITSPEVNELLQGLGEKAHCNNDTLCTGVDFDGEDSIDDEDYRRLTGITKEQFKDFVESIQFFRSTSCRSERTAVGLFLTKLRTGLPHGVLATLFGLKRKNIVSRIVHAVRASLMKELVPVYLWFQHMSREKVIQEHTSTLAKKLYADGDDDTAILIWDGTYIYCQKSANYLLQRQLFSMHKGRPLVEPMRITTSTGYILAVIGPYLANGANNNASITKHIMAYNIEELLQWLHDNDIMIVDRGFREALETMRQNGLRSEKPALLGAAEKQHNTKDANLSRLITVIR